MPKKEKKWRFRYLHIFTLKTIKTKFSVRTGLDICGVRYVLFPPHTALFRLQTLYLQVRVFLKSWICWTGSDSMSVSSRDSIWGSMLTFVYLFFSTWFWKKTYYSTLWIHPNWWGICVPYDECHSAPLRAETPVLETVRIRCCPRIWTTRTVFRTGICQPRVIQILECTLILFIYWRW